MKLFKKRKKEEGGVGRGGEEEEARELVSSQEEKGVCQQCSFPDVYWERVYWNIIKCLFFPSANIKVKNLQHSWKKIISTNDALFKCHSIAVVEIWLM